MIRQKELIWRVRSSDPCLRQIYSRKLPPAPLPHRQPNLRSHAREICMWHIQQKSGAELDNLDIWIQLHITDGNQRSIVPKTAKWKHPSKTQKAGEISVERREKKKKTRKQSHRQETVSQPRWWANGTWTGLDWRKEISKWKSCASATRETQRSTCCVWTTWGPCSDQPVDKNL